MDLRLLSVGTLLFVTTMSFSLSSVSADLLPMAPSTYSTHVASGSTDLCEDVVPILDPNRQEITKLCKSDYRACKFEGSCVFDTPEGKLGLTFHSFNEETEETYFSRVDTKICPYGYGYVSGKVYKQLKTRELCLDPFFGVSADLTVYNMGDVLFVPRLVGLTLPTGEIHDGYVIVRDSSTFMEGAGDYRITFFTGFYDSEHVDNIFSKIGLSDVDRTQYFRRVEGEEAQRVREKRNFPGLPIIQQ